MSNFEKFCREVSLFQNSFGDLETAEIDHIKIEILELPPVQSMIQDYDEEACSDDDEEIQETKTQSIANDIQSESDWNETNNSSDDSNYEESSSSKKKFLEKPKTVTRKKPRRAKSQKTNSKEVIELEIENCYKNSDGTISSCALEKYEKRWHSLRLICRECDKHVNGPLELKNHYLLEHTPGFGGFEKYKCGDCLAEVENFHKFLNHMTDAHASYLKFCCLLCSDSLFWNLDSLNLHYQSLHVDLSIFNCLFCGRFFKTSFYLSSHVSRFHKIQIRRDDGEISNPSQVGAHTVESLFALELSRDDIIECQNILELRDNEKNFDGSVTTNYYANKTYANQTTWSKLKMSCTECSLKFSSYQLSEHQNVHQNSKFKNFVCISCPEQKTFFNLGKSNLNCSFSLNHFHFIFRIFREPYFYHSPRKSSLFLFYLR